MINTETKDWVVSSMRESMAERLTDQLNGLDIEGFMKSNSADLVSQAVEKIQANVKVSIPEGIPVPEATLKVTSTGSGNEITVINISISSKIKADKKFRFANSFISNNTLGAITEWITEVYVQLVIDIMAEDNLLVVNEVLKKAKEIAGISYDVSMVSAIGGTTSKIAELSDEHVVFYADNERIFDVDDILALQEPSELISQEAIDGAIKQVAESLEESQTTVQLVANHGGILISLLANINKRTKIMALLKQVTNRNIENINTDKDLIAYYLKDGVFALVEQRDGNREVILSPFNTETLRSEKVNVL